MVNEEIGMVIEVVFRDEEILPIVVMLEEVFMIVRKIIFDRLMKMTNH